MIRLLTIQVLGQILATFGPLRCLGGHPTLHMYSSAFRSTVYLPIGRPAPGGRPPFTACPWPQVPGATASRCWVRGASPSPSGGAPARRECRARGVPAQGRGLRFATARAPSRLPWPAAAMADVPWFGLRHGGPALTRTDSDRGGAAGRWSAAHGTVSGTARPQEPCGHTAPRLQPNPCSRGRGLRLRLVFSAHSLAGPTCKLLCP